MFNFIIGIKVCYNVNYYDNRKFAVTTKVPETKGCLKCCAGKIKEQKYLCAALPSGILLMQWFDPLNKFMHLRVGIYLHLIDV